MVTIYGFGNALIDVHISIEEEHLSDIDIPKNTMKHINEVEMKDLLLRYQKNIVNQSPGGSIANSLYAANKMACYTNFSCALKHDLNGNIFLNGFSQKNHKSFIIESLKPTGVCLIFNTPDGERTMASNLGANEDLSPEALNAQSLMNSDWLLFDTYSLCTEGGFMTAKKSVEIAKENKVPICYGLADITLIKPNSQKISWLLDQEVNYIVGNSKEFLEFNKLFKISNSKQLITKGNMGATLDDIYIKAQNITSISTNGAGDGLMGAFIASLKAKGERKALKEAVTYASKICLVEEPRI